MSDITVAVGKEYLRELVQGLISAADELDAVIEAFESLVEDDGDDGDD